MCEGGMPIINIFAERTRLVTFTSRKRGRNFCFQVASVCLSLLSESCEFARYDALTEGRQTEKKTRRER